MHQNCLRVLEKGSGLNNAAACVHQQVALVGNFDVGVKRMAFHKVDDLFAKVVYVDDDMMEAVGNQVLDAMLQQRLAVELDQGLGTVLGQGSEPRADLQMLLNQKFGYLHLAVKHLSLQSNEA